MVAFIGGSFDGQTVDIDLVEEDGDWKLDEVEGFVNFDPEKIDRRFRKRARRIRREMNRNVIECVIEGLEELSDENWKKPSFSKRLEGLPKKSPKMHPIGAAAPAARRAPGYARRVALQAESEAPGERRRAPAGGADRGRRRPRRAAPRRAEPAPAGGRPPPRGPAAGDRRCRLGQDPGPHPPDRLSAGDRRGPAGGDPGDHLHQQGRHRDARAGRRPGRPRDAGDVGDDLPLRLRPHAARRRRAPRLFAQLHDLRRERLAADAEAVHERARHRPQALPAAGDPGADLRRQEQARRRRRLRRSARAASSRRPSPRPSRSTRSGCSPPTRWTSTTCWSAPSTRWSSSRRSASAGGGPSATSSSTSTRTPTTPSTGCCSCCAPSTAT